MFLAPLASLVPLFFTIWLFGTTGSLKSTLVALVLSHFGEFAFNTPPAAWTATQNALEKLAFVLKDTPLWIDDFGMPLAITSPPVSAPPEYDSRTIRLSEAAEW